VIVVSDSSPLITLARARHLELLREFYGEVLVPPEVYHEVTVAGAGMPGAEEVRKASWIQVRPNHDAPPNNVKAAGIGLGAGERSAIALASILDASLVLIDEGRARRAAVSVGLVVAGSIAILERGAQLGRVADLRLVFLELLEQGIRFDTRLLDQSLARLGLGKLGAS
jgi:predicted nucleic acid-binding protein